MAKEKEMKVEVGQFELVITIPMLKPLKPSKSGKTLVVATTHGNVPTSAVVNGKPLIVGLNAYISKAD